jgi:hypothetical protein
MVTMASRKALGKLALVLFGLCLATLLIDMGARLLWPERYHRLLPLSYRQADLGRIVEGDAYITFDRELGWAVAPGVERSLGQLVYRSNSAGMRADREYDRAPRPSVQRLAAFGDSFTHCDEVAFEECWTERTESYWPGAEILNFGVPGYSPDQAWLAYQRRADEYQPCAVLIGYMVENINRVVNRFRPFYEPETGITLSKPRFLLEGDRLTLLPNPATSPEQLRDPAWVEQMLGPHDNWYYPGLFDGDLLDTFLPVRVLRSAAYRQHTDVPKYSHRESVRIPWVYEEQGEAYQLAGRILIEFARQVERDGRTPVVLIFGREEDIVAERQRKDRVYEPLVEWLERSDIPVVDLTEVLGREARRGGTSALVDKHYRPHGHEVVAQHLAKELPSLTNRTCAR